MLSLLAINRVRLLCLQFLFCCLLLEGDTDRRGFFLDSLVVELRASLVDSLMFARVSYLMLKKSFSISDDMTMELLFEALVDVGLFEI